MTTDKTCPTCKFTYEAEEGFYKDRRTKDGYRWECICCTLARRVGITTEKQMWYSAKARAKRLRVPFEIEESDIEVPELCPVFGTKLELGGGESSPTLDRLEPGQGYVPNNIVVMSMRANRIKNDGTAVEHQIIANWMAGFYNNNKESDETHATD